mgnify:CR=1 FL=1
MNLAKYSLDNTKVVYFFLAVLLIGGIFLMAKSTTEIHHKIEKEEDMSAQTTSAKVVSSFNATAASTD